MNWYVIKENEFYYITEDEETIYMTFGDVNKGIAILRKTKMKKNWIRDGKLKKFVKGCRKQGFKEAETSYDPGSVKVIDLEPYALQNLRWHNYYENKTINQFWEIGIEDIYIHLRYGTIGGLGKKEKRRYRNRQEAENYHIHLTAEKKKQGFKEAVQSFSLKQVIKELEEKEKREKQREAKLEAAAAMQKQRAKTMEVKKQVFLADYKRYLVEGPLTEKFESWPECLKHLTPMNREIPPGMPGFIKESFISHGVKKEEEMFLPVKITNLLGKCDTHQFVSCPNIPAYYLKEMDDSPGEEVIGNSFKLMSYMESSCYYWFDCELIDKENHTISMRFVYNSGDADANEGFYGAVWHRETKELVADIMSTGDCETTIKASPGFCTSYKAHNTWLPVYFDREKYNSMAMQSVYYKESHEVEKLIHLLLLLHWETIVQA